MSIDQLPETRATESQPYVPEPRHGVPAYVRVIGIVLAAVMGLSTLGFIVLGAASILSVRVTDATTQTLSVSGTPRLVVQSDVVDLHITAGSANAVIVRTEREASALTYDLAQRDLRQMTAQASQSGDSITVTTHLPSFNDTLGVTRINMSVYVTVPPTANLDIHSGVGDISVAGVTGTFTIASKTGDLELSDATLVGATSLRDEVGSITCTCALADAASLHANTNTGDITLLLPQATSASLTASTSTGNVTIEPTWPLTVTHDDSGAHASGNLAPNPTGSITARSGVGDISIESR